MSAPLAYRGELVDIGFDWARRRMIAHVALPVAVFDPFTRSIGVPPAPADVEKWEETCPVALLACCLPSAAPGGEPVALAAAALDHLIQALADGALPEAARAPLADRFVRLWQALARTPGLPSYAPSGPAEG